MADTAFRSAIEPLTNRLQEKIPAGISGPLVKAGSNLPARSASETFNEVAKLTAEMLRIGTQVYAEANAEIPREVYYAVIVVSLTTSLVSFASGKAE